MKAALVIGLVSVGGAASAEHATIETSTKEARACLPLDGGDTLVGTGGGLVRVDEKGASRGVWTAGDGLPGTRIDSIVRDGDTIWIGTDGGLAEVKPDDDGGVTIGKTIATKPVRDVIRFGGKVYVATWDGGVLANKTPVAIKGGAKAARMRMSALAIAGGALYAGGEAGLYRLKGARFERVSKDAVTALAGDGDTLWIGSVRGIERRDGEKVTSLGGGEVRRLARIDGAITIAGADGLATIDRGRVVAIDHAPRGFAQALGGGPGGARCSGGLDGLDLQSAADAPWLHAIATSGPPSNDISAIVLDGDRLYAGTFDQGLAVRARGAWRTIELPEVHDRINTLLVADKQLWIGTAEGLVILDPAHDRVRVIGKRDGLPGRNVLALHLTSDGRIVAGTSQGAAFVDGARPERVGPKNGGPGRDIGNVWSIAEAPAGTLWLGTTTGLYRGPAQAWAAKDDGGQDWTRFSVATGALGDDWVTSLLASDDTIYAGTYNGGVAAIELATGTAAQLGGGWINPGGLAWDGDKLAAATMDGLVEHDARGWTALAGLPGKDTTAFVRAADGARYIATRRGLMIIRP
ncbi:MAG TPA: PQQ-binding-like beta-propeller repeat protein [Kofleriaceae bacterium]|nr:PQQ-binding-like beta-propeller repeat protein [Kofleriaceae bacterium]